MKIKFEENLEYQLEAINSITDIFSGQETAKTVFTVEKANNPQLSIIADENDLGTGNKLLLLPEEISENLNNIQTRNGLAKTEVLGKNMYNFSIEMETGTGKTYVYLRTIMELNKKYGFTKFIIVVPSLAIKEGVYKTLQITEEHFKNLYENTPYDYFIYDSKKINMIRNFAVNDNIQILIINIDSFNKDKNIINQERDQANGYRPMDYISQCNPIVIVDEPQNMESDIAKKAIKELNPLCTLRYSATHKERYNPVFKLDSIAAYEKKLVKQIEVATVGVTQNLNTEYIKVVSIKASKVGITAKIELDVKNKSSVSRKEISIKHGDILSEKAKRDIYDGYIVNEITYNEVDPAKSFIDFGKVRLTLGQINGGQDPNLIKRLQIRKTIQEHFEKQLALKSKGIKVLSLFFIDKVANYRIYDSETGEAKKGKYALMFEEEYNNFIQSGKYQGVGDVSKVHDGYFSVDKKKTKSGIEYFEDKDTKGNTNADNDTFTKIMKDKEKLLSFNEPLAFIFSHSALKEGWDNPNVFQICTLKQSSAETRKRQEIGRGMRLAVDQDGVRQDLEHLGNEVHEINKLTVIANESYDQFARGLQAELKELLADRPVKVDVALFENKVIENEAGEKIRITKEQAESIQYDLISLGYIDKKGQLTANYFTDKENNQLNLSDTLPGFEKQVVEVLESIYQPGKYEIENANNTTVQFSEEVNKENIARKEFLSLWNQINRKTAYQVTFDDTELIEQSVAYINEKLVVSQPVYNITQASADQMTKEGLKLDVGENARSQEYIENSQIATQYDLLGEVADHTGLTRKVVAEILSKIKVDKFEKFKQNPEEFILKVSKLINEQKAAQIIKHIQYNILEDEYDLDLFYDNAETAKLSDDHLLESTKGIYNFVKVDSDIERKFKESLEQYEDVRVYVKLPGKFKISTPLGDYNPDWAIAFREGSVKHIYFVAETKGSMSSLQLKQSEKGKIDCARVHFKALVKAGLISDQYIYGVVSSYEELLGLVK